MEKSLSTTEMSSHRDEIFIDGAWTRPEVDAHLEVVSPHTEQVIARVAAAGPRDVDRAVEAARAAFDNGSWPRMAPAQRTDVITRLGELYKESRGQMAELITAEMGAPATFAKQAHVRIPMMMMSAFCRVAAEYPFHESRPGLYGKDIQIRREPIGVVAAVVPWNMPQLLIIAKVIPALLAGCTVVLKPAPETPLDALLLTELFQLAGLPSGVFNVVPGDAAVGDALVRHTGVDKVTFTGSTNVGRQIAGVCGADLRQVSLELGGKSAAIVLDDADPATVATAIHLASLTNSGQICNALTRILVPATRGDEYVAALAERMEALRVGDPADPATDIGPLVSARQQARVKSYIEIGEREGARLVTGGAALPAGLDRGWYVQPTLFTDAENGMRIAREEIFGPVLTVIPYRDEVEAVSIANNSEYGLAGSVFTAETDRALAIAARIRTGSFGINEGYIMDPLAPFGGVKQSGYGRELGREGFDGYVDTKSISGA
jgi:acyl-CoA reductase-like NAD-dependent aldehyde dehydrogenase